MTSTVKLYQINCMIANHKLLVFNFEICSAFGKSGMHRRFVYRLAMLLKGLQIAFFMFQTSMSGYLYNRAGFLGRNCVILR